MKFKPTLISIPMVCLASAAGFIGCEKAPPPAPPPTPKVSVLQPETREVADYDEYNGWMDAAETVEVRARVRGHIDKVNFTDGEIVKKDQLLFELDPRPFQSGIDRAKDQLKVYQAQATAADREEARLKDLLTKGGASQSQVDKAEADAQSFKAQIEASKQEIIRAGLDLEYSRITAPIAGRVSRAMLTVGNLVNAGGSDPILTTIVTIDPIYIYFPVDERALQRYQKDRNRSAVGTLKELKVSFKFGLETDEGFPHEGVLEFAENRVDATTGTIIVRGTAPNANGRFFPGSRVRVRIPVRAAQSVALVPDTAILSDQDKKYLLLIDDKNVVQRRDVAVGRLLDDGMRVILPAGASGKSIAAGDWVIVEGLQSARLNYPVEPIRSATTQPATQPKTVATAQ